MSDPSASTTLVLSRRARLVAIAGGAAVLVLLGSMLGMLVAQLRHVASQDRKITRLLADSQPVLQRSGPLLDQATPLIRDTRPLARSARTLVLPARRAAFAVNALVAQLQPILAQFSPADLRLLADTVMAATSTVLPLLRELEDEGPRLLRSATVLTETLNDDRRLVRLIDSSDDLVGQLQDPRVQRLGRNALVSVPELVGLQRTLLSVQLQTLRINLESLDIQRDSLSTQKDSLSIQRETLDIVKRSLEIQERALDHVRSIDQKTGGELPSP